MLYVFLLGLLAVCVDVSEALTHLSIHGTDVEKAQWQTRAVSGPYKSDWDEVKERADAFRSSPGPRWAGNNTSPVECYDGLNITISRTFDMGLRDAAFVYFVTGDTSYVANVRQELLEQTTITGTKFQDTARWCTTTSTATTRGFGNGVGVWLRKLAYAYSYIKPTLSTADQNTLNTWFTNAGVHIQTILDLIVKKRFPGRLSDDYTLTSTYATGGSDHNVIHHFGGPMVKSFHDAWNNEGTGTAAALAVIARLINNTTMRSHAARYVREWVTYGTFPGGHSLEEARWGYGATSNTPQHGYLYTGVTISSMICAIDMLARDGYVNLFDYSTSTGVHGTAGFKSVKQILLHFAALTAGTPDEYADIEAGGAQCNPGDAICRIDSVGPTMHRIEYIWLAQGNLHYQDAALKTAYEKPIVAGYGTSGCDMLGGDWCNLPGVRFMYGGLEGVSLPYGSVAAPEPDYISNLTMHLKFDEGTGPTAQDSTANNHDGTLNAGATWGPAKMGASAVTLDGTATGIVTVAGELGTPAAVTLAAWVKMSAFPTPEAHVLSIGDSAQIAVTSTLVRGWYYTGTNWSKVEATRTLGTTDWHHLAFVAQAGTQQLYLDGALVASGSNGSAIGYAGLGTNTILGGHGAGITTNYRFQGTIDDARVYSRALSATDIAGLAALAEPAPLAIQITAPTTNTSLSTDASPLTNMGGTASDGIGVTGITWTCPTCTPTTDAAVCTPACGAATTFVNWTIPSISLAPNTANVITVTAADASGNATDALTVTYTPPVVGGEAPCTHYASPAGGGNGSAPGNALQVAQFWAVATPGTVLCLVDGTYSDNNSLIKPPASFAGTASQPITIRALNDGKAHIAGGTIRPVHLQGSWGILAGVNISGGDNASLGGVDADDWVVRRVVVWNNEAASPAGNMTIISIHGQRLLLEDWAAFGKARKVFQAGKDGNLGRRVLRGWTRFEECPACNSGNPTNSFEIGYDETHVSAFNNLSTRHEVGVNTSPEMAFNMFSTTNSHIKGHIAYAMPSYNYVSSRMLHISPTAGSHPGQTNTSDSTITDSVAIIAPGHPNFTSRQSYQIEGTPGTGNVATNVVGISGVAGTCGGSWTCSQMKQGTTVAGAIGAGTTIWETVPGICKRYDTEGTLTDVGLWPNGQWPMNQRILDAMTLSGRTPVNVTNDLVSLFGPIPAACQTGTSAETCTPPLVGTPPTCSCPAGTVPPNCDPEPPPETCPPDCPVQDVFVIAPAAASPPGVDTNACTLEAPCLTVNRARSLMTPGDTLYLRGGTYTGSANRTDTSTAAFPAGNDASTPTKIAGYAGETAVLQQTSGVVMSFTNPTTDHYLVLDRLTCDGAASPGNDTQCLVFAGGVHHIRVQNCTLRNTHFAGLSVTDSAAIEVVDTTIHGSTHSSGASVTGSSDSVLFDKVTMHTNAVHGLTAAHSGLSNLTIRDSTAHHNGSTGFQLRASNLLAANLLAHTNALGLQLLSGAVGARVLNVTLADNSGNELQLDAGVTETVLTNVLAVGGIVDNGTGTVQTTNYTGDPGFVGSGNYHLALATSPAIDAGTCLPGVVDVALDGVSRPQPTGGACDIGAFEQSGDEVPPVPTPGPLSARPYGSKLFFAP